MEQLNFIYIYYSACQELLQIVRNFFLKKKHYHTLWFCGDVKNRLHVLPTIMKVGAKKLKYAIIIIINYNNSENNTLIVYSKILGETKWEMSYIADLLLLLFHNFKI